jgi:5-methylcytosine-specific restriction endonuclease McrA
MAKKSYSEKLLDPRWQQMRLRVFERDKWKCVICGDAKKTLHAHHPVYHPMSDGPWDYEDEQIITLCKDCHDNEHDALDIAKANLLLAVLKLGVKTSSDMEVFVDYLSILDMESLEKFFIWMNHGTNKNN